MREQDGGGRNFIGEEGVGTMGWAEFGWTNERAGFWEKWCVCACGRCERSLRLLEMKGIQGKTLL